MKKTSLNVHSVLTKVIFLCLVLGCCVAFAAASQDGNDCDPKNPAKGCPGFCMFNNNWAKPENTRFCQVDYCSKPENNPETDKGCIRDCVPETDWWCPGFCDIEANWERGSPTYEFCAIKYCTVPGYDAKADKECLGLCKTNTAFAEANPELCVVEEKCDPKTNPDCPGFCDIKANWEKGSPTYEFCAIKYCTRPGYDAKVDKECLAICETNQDYAEANPEICGVKEECDPEDRHCIELFCGNPDNANHEYCKLPDNYCEVNGWGDYVTCPDEYCAANQYDDLCRTCDINTDENCKKGYCTKYGWEEYETCPVEFCDSNPNSELCNQSKPECPKGYEPVGDGCELINLNCPPPFFVQVGTKCEPVRGNGDCTASGSNCGGSTNVNYKADSPANGGVNNGNSGNNGTNGSGGDGFTNNGNGNGNGNGNNPAFTNNGNPGTNNGNNGNGDCTAAGSNCGNGNNGPNPNSLTNNGNGPDSNSGNGNGPNPNSLTNNGNGPDSNNGNPNGNNGNGNNGNGPNPNSLTNNGNGK